MQRSWLVRAVSDSRRAETREVQPSSFLVRFCYPGNGTFRQFPTLGIHNGTLKVPLHFRTTIIDEIVRVILSLVNDPPILVIAKACIIEDDSIASLRGAGSVEVSRLVDEAEGPIRKIDLIEGVVYNGGRVVSTEAVTLTRIAVVHGIVPPHNPPITYDLTSRDIFKDSDVLRSFAGAGNGGEVHAFVLLQASHEIRVGLAGVTEGADASAILHFHLPRCLVLVEIAKTISNTLNILGAHGVGEAGCRLGCAVCSHTSKVDRAALHFQISSGCCN